MLKADRTIVQIAWHFAVSDLFQRRTRQSGIDKQRDLRTSFPNKYPVNSDRRRSNDRDIPE